MLSAALILGGLLAAGAVAPGYHPQPRVIVDVHDVDGPHERSDVQREARAFLWHKIIRCYRAGAASKPKLKGDATFAVRVAPSGNVSSVRSTGGTIGDEGVVACWAKQIAKVPMPKAPGSSAVVLSVQVAPGDPPRR